MTAAERQESVREQLDLRSAAGILPRRRAYLVVAVKAQFEGFRTTVVARAACEGLNAIFDGVEIGKIVRRQCFAREDGELDFDLVEPTGMDRQ